MPRAAINVRIEVLGEEQINRRLLRWAGRAGNAVPVWETIAEYLMAVERAQFDTQGAYSGHPWAPLKEATIMAKQRRGEDPRILHATLAMRNALTQKGDQHQRLQMTKSMMRFGIKGLNYPNIIQRKVVDGGRPRKPVDLTEKNKVVIAKMVQLWIARGVAASVPTP